MLFVRHFTSTETSKDWAYIGTANCSESAWGKLVKDRYKNPKLNCRNWECGVVVPLRRMTADAHGEMSRSQSRSGDESRSGLEMFEGKVPVPMQYPGNEYGSRVPWFYGH